MQLLCIVSMVAALASAPATAAAQAAPAAQTTKKAPAAKASAAGRTVELTGGDDMKYSVTSINAKPGETIHIVLKNVGAVPKIAMAHNVIVLKAGVDAAQFSQAAMTARETDYVPVANKADILASTKLAGPGETVEVTFKVPAKAGTYPFVCTFPGHYAAGMRGEITVK